MSARPTGSGASVGEIRALVCESLGAHEAVAAVTVAARGGVVSVKVWISHDPAVAVLIERAATESAYEVAAAAVVAVHEATGWSGHPAASRCSA